MIGGRIFAINRFYRPDQSATSQMLTDLAERLASVGAPVCVLTSRLNYEGGAGLPKRETLAGVEVRRLPTTMFGRKAMGGRLADYVTFHLSAFFLLLWLGRRGDVVIAKTDPPMLSVTAALAARLRGMKLVNWCQDLFPETAGALGHRWAYTRLAGVLRALRNWSLKSAEFNAVIHERMAERLRAAGTPAHKIRVLENWADGDIRAIPRDENPLRAQWGLEGRFVIGYAGNLGRAHLPERVAELVRITSSLANVTWLFVGGGAGLPAVQALPQNAIVFKPYQAREDLSRVLSAPDLHLISLNPACEGYVVPSKYYGVVAAGRKVLFLGERQGAIAREIEKNNVGIVLDPERPDTWLQDIQRLAASAGGEAVGPGNQAGPAMANWCAALRDSDCLPLSPHPAPSMAPIAARA